MNGESFLKTMQNIEQFVSIVEKNVYSLIKDLQNLCEKQCLFMMNRLDHNRKEGFILLMLRLYQNKLKDKEL